MNIKKFVNKIIKKNKSSLKHIEKQNNIWFVTGCSSGIGKALCNELLERGYKVAAGLRKKERLDKLKNEYYDNLLLLELDVTDEEQIKKAIDDAINYFGKIDVFVNNAGISCFGAIEEFEIEEAKKCFDVNLWGTVRCIKNILPHMRINKNGLIINISSVCGIEAFPGVTYYSASKFAIEGFSEALRKEVASLGIKVMVVNLSTARTNFSINMKYEKPKILAYQEILKNGINEIENKLEYKTSKISPVKLVKAIIDDVEKFDNEKLILGSDCFCIGINKYKHLLKFFEKQAKNPYDVEFEEIN